MWVGKAWVRLGKGFCRRCVGEFCWVIWWVNSMDRGTFFRLGGLVVGGIHGPGDLGNTW